MITVFDFNPSNGRISKISVAGQKPDRGLVRVVRFYELFMLSKKNLRSRGPGRIWAANNLYVKGVEGMDFYKHEERSEDKPGRPKIEYYCSLSFSKGLCVVFNTMQARKLRIWLDQNY